MGWKICLLFPFEPVRGSRVVKKLTERSCRFLGIESKNISKYGNRY